MAVGAQHTEAMTVDGMRAAVVILAGGMGARVGAEVNKVLLPVGGRHMLEYSLMTAVSCENVTDLVLVHRPDDVDQIERLVSLIATDEGREPNGIVVHTTLGGETRHASEYAGVAALRSRIDGGHVDVVAVHDGARPFMGRDLLTRTLVAAATDGAVIPGVKVIEPLFALDEQRFVDPHDHVWVQTPQAFDAVTLLRAHDAAADAGFEGVDTAEVVQRFSDMAVQVVPGHDANIKITYQTDLATAEALAADWERTHRQPERADKEPTEA